MDGFHLHYDYPGLGWKMTLELLKFRYIIKKGETHIATVKYTGHRGCAGYKMDIPDPANAELVLAAVVAMHIIEDKASQRQRHHRHHHHHHH